jgi:hypothetical protein
MDANGVRERNKNDGQNIAEANADANQHFPKPHEH